MARLTIQDAREVIASGGAPFDDLVEAAAVLASAPEAAYTDLVQCLQHPGIPAEFAAMSLYARTRRERPDNTICSLVTDADDWKSFLLQRNLLTPAAALPEASDCSVETKPDALSYAYLNHVKSSFVAFLEMRAEYQRSDKALMTDLRSVNRLVAGIQTHTFGIRYWLLSVRRFGAKDLVHEIDQLIEAVDDVDRFLDGRPADSDWARELLPDGLKKVHDTVLRSAAA